MENSCFVMVSNGNVQENARSGVAVVMSPSAVKAWILAGSKVVYYGNRIIAVKFRVRDAANKLVNVVFVSAYAPVCATMDHRKKEYYDDLQQCVNDCRKMSFS